MEFLRSFLRRHFAGNPAVASRNVGCFLRLPINVVRQTIPGVLLGILGGGVPPGSPNPDPISDQKMSFSTSIFRPDL